MHCMVSCVWRISALHFVLVLHVCFLVSPGTGGVGFPFGLAMAPDVFLMNGKTFQNIITAEPLWFLSIRCLGIAVLDKRGAQAKL